jgi:RNA polymerase sigma-70 factor (ECF subfamily)
MPSRPESERSFERLYRCHRQDVYRFALRDVRDPDEAEDVTQIAFLNAYRALSRGQPPERPRAWLLTIARNVARRRFRSRRPEIVALSDDLTVAAPDDYDGPTAADISSALRQLRPSQRRALVLREILGWSYAEIARDLDLSVSAVETLIFRARRSLREQLERTRGGVRGVLALPLWLQDLIASLTRAGMAVRAAGMLGAAAIGTGVALVGAAPSAPAAPQDAGAQLSTLGVIGAGGQARVEAVFDAAAVAALREQQASRSAAALGPEAAVADEDPSETVKKKLSGGLDEVVPVPLPDEPVPLPEPETESESEIEPPPPPPLPDADDVVPDPPPPPPLPEPDDL